MDLTKLRSNQIQLIEFMKEGGYAKGYIDKVKAEINKLLKYGEQHSSYFDYYEKYIKNHYSNRRIKLYILTLIMNFDLYDIFPNRQHHFEHKIIDNSNYAKLNSYYKSIIDNYKIIKNSQNKKSKTIYCQSKSCESFLLYLQNKGFEKFDDVREKDILDFFLDKNDQLKVCSTFARNIKTVLKKSISIIPECEKIVNYIPTINTFRKNIDYLTNEEINKIKEALSDKNNYLDLRDKAIVTLLLYTGIRGCDVANLKLSDIDWKNEKIVIIQSKTDVSLELPLTTSIGNSLFAYIKNERPKINLDRVFIRKDVNLPITKSSVTEAVKHVFKEVNIRQNDGKRKGTHIFRYNLATTLLKNEIPQPIISQILGHSSSEPLKYYLNADFYHLKQCSLSIEKFKDIKGVI